MFYNAHGLLMHKYGRRNFDYAGGNAEKENGRFRQIIHATRRRFICGWGSFSVGKLWWVTGVRVFHDYLREKHQQRDCYEALLELEKCALLPSGNRVYYPGALYLCHRAQTAEQG